MTGSVPLLRRAPEEGAARPSSEGVGSIAGDVAALLNHRLPRRIRAGVGIGDCRERSPTRREEPGGPRP